MESVERELVFEQVLGAWKRADVDTFSRLESQVDRASLRFHLGRKERTQLSIYDAVCANPSAPLKEIAATVRKTPVYVAKVMKDLKSSGFVVDSDPRYHAALVQEFEARDTTDPASLYIDAWEAKEVELLKDLEEFVDFETLVETLPTTIREKYSLYLDLKANSMTYAEVAAAQNPAVKESEVRSFALQWQKAGMLPKRKRGRRKDRDYKNSGEFGVRNVQIVAYAQEHPELTYAEIGKEFGALGGERVQQILSDYGVKRNNPQIIQAEQRRLQKGRKSLVDVLSTHVENQRTFDRLVKKAGFDYALAWRVQNAIGQGSGKKLDTGVLAKMIHYRRMGEGLHRTIRLSGYRATTEEIKKVLPSVNRILNRALHDVEISGTRKVFGEHSGLSLEQQKEFVDLYSKGTFTYDHLSEHFGGISVPYWIDKLELPSRKKESLSEDQQREFAQMHTAGVMYSEISEYFGGISVKHWANELGLPKRKKRLTEEQQIELAQMFVGENASYAEISSHFNGIDIANCIKKLGLAGHGGSRVKKKFATLDAALASYDSVASCAEALNLDPAFVQERYDVLTKYDLLNTDS